MKARWILLACVLAGCENPEGQTGRFLAGATKDVENARGKVPPLPEYRPRPAVTPLVIERDPFKR